MSQVAPRVSVVMPAYNAEATIAEAIDSVLAQDLADLELIVVDDGAIDATAEIVAGYAARDRRVRLIRQDNAGVSATRNRAIAEARAAYVAFLDADDAWEPDKLAHQAALLDRRPEVGFCYTAQTIIDGAGRAISTYAVKPDYRGRCLPALARSNGIGLSTVMARTELLRAVGGFDETLDLCEDWELWIRLAERTELDYVDAPLTRYRFHPGNSTRDLDRLRAAHLAVLARCQARYGRDADSAGAHFKAHMGFARRYIAFGSLRTGLREAWLALRARPLSVAAYVAVAKLLVSVVLRRRPNPNMSAQIAKN
ncbi:MAG: glycosyltransferase [Alphaproteobacteria bacterium]